MTAQRATGGHRRPQWFVRGDRAWFPVLYEAFFTATPLGRRLRAAEIDAVERAEMAHLRATDRVLEVGAGTGTYTALLDRHVAVVEVVEPAAAMRRYLRRRAEREAWQHTAITDGQLPGGVPADGRFDGAVAIGVLNYLPDLPAALRDLAASVHPGGWVLVNVPARRARTYARIEALGRRRVYRRSPHKFDLAATAAGLSITAGPTAAGVTDLYRCAREH